MESEKDVSIRLYSAVINGTISPMMLGKMIQKFAEEHHKQECLECKQKKASYKLFGVD